jgi:pimeloyl-ACP methyl ester carboxylesterase
MTSTTAHPSATRSHGSIVVVDGIPTYYEVQGSGDPVVLLHGGMCSAETFDLHAAALADRYRVYVPERPGHGRTPDVDGPFSYEQMARHTIGLMDLLGIASAHLAGWSDGALVGLLVALRRPLLARSLVLIDQSVTVEGAADDYASMAANLSLEHLPDLAHTYAALSPDGPDHAPVVFEKLRTLWTADTGVDLSDLARVTVPTLVLAADRGLARLDHLAAVVDALPDAQLAVVPGTTHSLPLEKPDLVVRLLLDFFAIDPIPTTS